MTDETHKALNESSALDECGILTFCRKGRKNEKVVFGPWITKGPAPEAQNSLPAGEDHRGGLCAHPVECYYLCVVCAPKCLGCQAPCS